MVIAFFLVYESVLATLAGTHISPPGSLTCALRETWQGLVHRKENTCIERIQNAFDCCGFMSTQDMAFPFQDAKHGTDACVVRYERDQACFEPWRQEERKVAVMLLIVPLAVFLWKVSNTRITTHSEGVYADNNRWLSCWHHPLNHRGWHRSFNCQAIVAKQAVPQTAGDHYQPLHIAM